MKEPGEGSAGEISQSALVTSIAITGPALRSMGNRRHCICSCKGNKIRLARESSELVARSSAFEIN